MAGSRRRAGARPSASAAAHSVARFLDAMGLPPQTRRGRELAGTPIGSGGIGQGIMALIILQRKVSVKAAAAAPFKRLAQKGEQQAMFGRYLAGHQFKEKDIVYGLQSIAYSRVNSN